jgi:hypothetical protein
MDFHGIRIICGRSIKSNGLPFAAAGPEKTTFLAPCWRGFESFIKAFPPRLLMAPGRNSVPSMASFSSFYLILCPFRSGKRYSNLFFGITHYSCEVIIAQWF